MTDPISKLTLGTVQLGLDYGIANSAGKPDQLRSNQILDAAISKGINTLDTAYDYGNAEAVIGEFIRTRADKPSINIVSKFRILQEHLGNYDLIRKDVFAKVNTSLLNLGIEKMPVYLFHQGKDQPLDIMAQDVSKILEELKSEGLIEKGGISFDRPANIEMVLESNCFDCVQIPINIFDQHLIADGILQKLKRNGKIVFARSIFLQGLFFLKPDQLSGNLEPAEMYLKKLNRLAEEAGLSVAELTFSFVRDIDGITSLIFGAEQISQVHQNLSLLGVPAISNDIRDESARIFADMPDHIITPRLWQR